MDIGLPDVDGFEAAGRLVTLKKAARVIVLTGRGGGKSRQTGSRSWDAFYLSKSRIHETARDANQPRARH